MPDTLTLPFTNPANISTIEDVVEALRHELAACMIRDEKFFPLLNQELAEALEQTYPQVDAAISALLERLRAGADDDLSALQAHGLDDEQILPKLVLVKLTMTERNALYEVTNGKAPSLLPLAQKKVFAALDIILKSLADALKLGGLVEEWKTVLERAF